MAAVTTYKSPLHEMTQTTPTCLWNDSVVHAELLYSLSHGAVGATCNPVIVLDALKQEREQWTSVVAALAHRYSTASERDLAWRLAETISVERAALLQPVFEAYGGKNGRLSIQTDPALYRDAKALTAQALRFHALAPNMIVKIPATAAGIQAMEEATALGVSVNATVSFSLPQCVAVAKAVERGLRRREQAGLECTGMGPVCTIMMGRLDDWLKLDRERRAIPVDPAILDWAGIAVFKQTYRIFAERGYRLRLLAAAFRNHLHWSELIGADAVLSPPTAWQEKFNASGIEVRNRIDTPVDDSIVQSLLRWFPDFAAAYFEDGIPLAQFDSYATSVRTLRQFTEAVHELERQVRNVLLPDPDAR